jgi:very-short-patch-repair endonuclease
MTAQARRLRGDATRAEKKHNDPRHQAADAGRSQLLRSKGITILRFWNNEVIEKTEEVWDVISRTAATLSLRPATPTPALPLLGGGRRQ